MADYSPQIATAQRLIAAKGRVVSFVKLPDGLNPLSPLGAPTGAPVTVSGVSAVFVSPGAALGMLAQQSELFKHCSQIAIVGAVPGYDLSEFDTMTDFDNSTWVIDHVETLRPAEQIILYYIGVKRA